MTAKHVLLASDVCFFYVPCDKSQSFSVYLQTCYLLIRQRRQLKSLDRSGHGEIPRNASSRDEPKLLGVQASSCIPILIALLPARSCSPPSSSVVHRPLIDRSINFVVVRTDRDLVFRISPVARPLSLIGFRHFYEHSTSVKLISRSILTNFASCRTRTNGK